VSNVEGAHDTLVDPAGNDELDSRAKAKGSKTLVAPGGGQGSSAVETSVGWLQNRCR
jgi:hypothetical protein